MLDNQMDKIGANVPSFWPVAEHLRRHTAHCIPQYFWCSAIHAEELSHNCTMVPNMCPTTVLRQLATDLPRTRAVLMCFVIITEPSDPSVETHIPMHCKQKFQNIYFQRE